MKILKRITAFILAITTILCMSACSNYSDNGSSSENTVSTNSPSGTESTSVSSDSPSVKTESLPDSSLSGTDNYASAPDNSSNEAESSESTIESSFSETDNTENSEVKKAVFDFENKRVLLNSGYYMPIVGLGTYALPDDVCVNSVNALLENGGRLIDTASFYGTEDSVGEAVRNSKIPREEIFVTTKLYPNQFANAAAEIDKALEETGLDYIDLMLLHHPGSHDVEAYKALEQAVRDGKIRSIGLSNWYIEELEEFLPQVDTMPTVVQNEIHPYYQENDVIPYIQELGIVVEGWFPFGGRGHTKEILGDSVITEIASAHGVTSAQVVLRWNLQKGVVVIPGSSNPEHIRENLDVFDFELTEEEISRINALNRDEKHEWY